MDPHPDRELDRIANLIIGATVFMAAVGALIAIETFEEGGFKPVQDAVKLFFSKW